MDINNSLSDLRMDWFYFDQCSVKRGQNIADGQYQMDLNRQINKVEAHSYELTLVFSIEKEDLSIRVSAKAKFTYLSDDCTNERTIIEKNTVAIMFPFIRSEVTLLTSQPGMTPIVLPPVNTARMEF